MILQTLLLAGSVVVLRQPAPGPEPSTLSLHAPFSRLLKDHLRHDLVDYDAFAKSPDFPRYLHELSATRVEPMSKPDRMAFWINVYNAYTIELINRHQERESIRNINMFLGVLKGKRPWKEDIVQAGGRTLNLDDVEQILRAEFKDPRIHMALVRAALSSPPLRSEAYEGAILEGQLSDQTRTFLRERQTANRLDLGNSIIHLSPIFDWFRADFGKTDAAILKFVAPHFEGRGELSAFSGPRLSIEFTDFDWSLNLQKPRETQ